ncbi:MAG: insulinase family protein [Gracilimonas sp.]|uniref:M16 family metallopeptidase n=1 Tax=Gracilimonas sp. TaxID=1974203 RepID=UPI001B09F33A|nr:pitrilysin family protein [Gracilimonas sp.]MBO6586794.1 insulinase family protein [Gracilimonas sp.]MBO6615451.1 insulinase family protein [Gracilimonas sp.]
MKPRILYLFSALLISSFITASCVQKQTEFSVEYEKFTLDNGLEVIFHKDHSDPVVAVALTFHVGSAREIEGRTGFAHLFEHLLFLESENLGKGGLDKMSSRIGGSGANGSTSRDRTNYFQTVPKDALEKMIWAEADKLGYFINTVTEAVLAKEKQVVKNEKRQGVDNAPYGHANYVVGKNMYPAEHPYNWQVIGSLEDLQNATLQDVKDFYNQWYVPNNATLVIAGDFDSEQAKAWIHKYFDEIPRGEDIEPLPDMPADLDQTKKKYYEDNFARLPELRLVWPGVDLYHEDAYALDILTELLADGKKAPLYKVLVEEQELTSNVYMNSGNSELAGEIAFITRAYPNTDLNDVAGAVNEAFMRFEDEGFTQADLDRIKAGIETDFYNGLSSVLGKAFQLAQYNIFAGDPGYINKDIQKTLAVTKEDVMRVYQKYIKGQYFVATSFVPQRGADLALDGSEPAEVVEEEIVQNGEGESFSLPEETAYEKTPSSFDRSVEPPYGESPDLKVPEIWETELASGLDVYGIENYELPLVEFEITIKGGLMLENPEKTGVANLVAELLTKGTANKTPEELEQAIDELGASINIFSGRQSVTIRGNSLARYYDETMALVEEMLLEPRWDEREFELAKQSTMSQIAQQSANPNSIATNTFNKLLYGEDHILSFNPIGTTSSIEAIKLDDLQAYYANYISPSVADMHVVGAIDQSEVVASLDNLNDRWEAKEVELPEFKTPEPPSASKVYFYDVPDAKQSVLRFGYLAMPETHPDFYPAEVMNYKLGGGGFASRFTQELREGKGYTYGIGSGFSGSDIAGPFVISSGVRTNVTYESAALVKEILEDYPDTFTEEDLKNTKSFLLKSNARRFETLGAKLNLLENISAYGWSPDYIKQREEVVKNMTQERIQELARTYANPDKMIWLVVGDAKTQMDRLQQLGFGDPILVNEYFKEGK